MDNSNNPNTTNPNPPTTGATPNEPSSQAIPQDPNSITIPTAAPAPTTPWSQTPTPVQQSESTISSVPATATSSPTPWNPESISTPPTSIPSDTSLLTSQQPAAETTSQSFNQSALTSPTLINDSQSTTTPSLTTDPITDLNPQQEATNNAPTSSPLDNPWSMLQNTNLGSAPIPQSTFDPSPTSTPSIGDQILPAAQPATDTPQTPPSSIPTVDTTSAPTDLSHLLGNNSQPINDKNINSAETLVVPPQSAPTTPDVPTASGTEHKSMPKWLIGVAVGLLILVVGASAYFILGIGQPAKNAASLPAEVSTPTVKTPPPIATPTPQQSGSEASNSANFGQLQGNTPQTATRAADRIPK